MKFIKFVLIWISQQLAIPFWMVGHFHLSVNMGIYDDVKILFASLGMNVLVAIGFGLIGSSGLLLKLIILKPLQQQITQNSKSITKTSTTVNKVINEISQMKVYK